MNSVRPSSVRWGVSCALYLLGMHFIPLCIPRAQPKASRYFGTSL